MHPDDLGWVMQMIQDHFEGKTPILIALNIGCNAKTAPTNGFLDRGASHLG